MNKDKIIIIGNSETARLMRLYLIRSNYAIGAFTVDREFITEDFFNGIPVVEFAHIEEQYPPSKYKAIIGIGSTHKLAPRKSMFERAKEKGYAILRYIHPTTFIDSGVKIGEGSFIFENNTIQNGAGIGDNTILWSGNHLGHMAKVGSHCFISSHVVLCGYSQVGDSCFIGVNAAIAPNVKIGNSCVIGMGTSILRDVPDNTMIPGKDSRDGQGS